MKRGSTFTESLFASSGEATATFVYKLDQAMRKHYKIVRGGLGAVRKRKKNDNGWYDWFVVNRYWKDGCLTQKTLGKLSKVLREIGWNNDVC